MPSKSIFRQPGAKHFQLVHRSQRDPQIHNPEASQHVLKPIERENVKKGKSRADLEADGTVDGIRPNAGEASLYGVYYDDTEYDYMQHLRQVGVKEDGVESILIEAPVGETRKRQATKSKGIELKDIPQDALPSAYELPRTYESQQAIPESIAGFQPDMDPHLRQVLEALEDDEFVDDGLEDDFFGELVKGGERGDDEVVEYAFEEGEHRGDNMPDGEQHGADWERRFANFKLSHQRNQSGDSDDDFETEDGDTLGGLPHTSVIGGKRRRKGASDASGYSMSSSSMHRNEALKTLDERFDQMILREYDEDSTGQQSDSDPDDADEAPALITSRADFDSMMNEFLDDYEILGRKMKPKLAGETGFDKLDTLRRAMGQDERVLMSTSQEDEVLGGDSLLVDQIDSKDRWDCETILTTYSNLENHPRLIRASVLRPTPKIHFNPKTGLPYSLQPSQPERRPSPLPQPEDSGTESEDTDVNRPRVITRSRDETKEEKKARKSAVKAQRQVRRQDKKATKEQFSNEHKTQTKLMSAREQKMKKL